MKRFLKNFPVMAAMMALAAMLAGAVAQPAFADAREHRLAIHVDEKDPRKMKMALNNAKNVTKYYASKGEKVKVEIVAYGPGLHMLRADTSPVKQQIASMSLEFPNVAFAACGNTQSMMERKEKKKVPLLKEAKRVTAGVVRLMELQEQGWSYVRP